MTALTTVRRSRRLRRCDNCERYIGAGERYRRVSLTPYSEFNAGPHWWTISVHDECPVR